MTRKLDTHDVSRSRADTIAEALAMMRCDGARAKGAAAAESVERRVVMVEERVAEAARILRAAQSGAHNSDGHTAA